MVTEMVIVVFVCHPRPTEQRGEIALEVDDEFGPIHAATSLVRIKCSPSTIALDRSAMISLHLNAYHDKTKPELKLDDDSVALRNVFSRKKHLFIDALTKDR